MDLIIQEKQPMSPYLFTAIATGVGVAGLGLAYGRFRRDEGDKQANFQVEKIEWVQPEETVEGILHVSIKNCGGRPAKSIRISIRMIDGLLQSLPAPNFDVSCVNELPAGASFDHSFSWFAHPIYSHVNVQVLVTAADAMTGKPYPPKEFYYIWGELNVFKFDQPFRDMTQEEKARLKDFLAQNNYRRKIGRYSVLAVPGVPEF
jgi:hypothetical protein